MSGRYSINGPTSIFTTIERLAVLNTKIFSDHLMPSVMLTGIHYFQPLMKTYLFFKYLSLEICSMTLAQLKRQTKI